MLCLWYIREGMKGKGANENEIKKRDGKVRGEEIQKGTYKGIIEQISKERGNIEVKGKGKRRGNMKGKRGKRRGNM